MSLSASIEAQTLTTGDLPEWASASSSAKASPSSTEGEYGWIAHLGLEVTVPTIIKAAHSTWPFPPAHRPLPQERRRWAQKGAGKDNRSPDTHKGPLLIVEDDPDILSTVGDILEFEGYKVEKAANGAEGLAVIERVQPALVLLDMRMPVLDGWEFARILKERGISVPVLVMTAARDAHQWAQEIGARGYVAKPFHLSDLIAAVEKALLPDKG